MNHEIEVTHRRYYSAHHTLLSTAWMSLKSARDNESGSFYNNLIAITFSAIAIEALLNPVGKKLIDNWDEDLEKSCSPIAKLRILNIQLNEITDFAKHPWGDIKWLLKFRNKVAHPKSYYLEEVRVMAEEEYNNLTGIHPKSGLELQVTLKNAEKSVDAAYWLRDYFVEKLDIEDIMDGIASDGHQSTGTRIQTEQNGESSN